MEPIGVNSHRAVTFTKLAPCRPVLIDWAPTHPAYGIVLVENLSRFGDADLIGTLPLFTRLVTRIAIDSRLQSGQRSRLPPESEPPYGVAFVAIQLDGPVVEPLVVVVGPPCNRVKPLSPT